MFSVRTNQPEETFALGERMAPYLPPGTVVALTGELGAGKTLFAKGIARGLKVQGQVTSPTFTIINEYQGKLPLFHIDAYRLEEDYEIDELGLDEYLNSTGITLIEWPERIRTYLPDSYIRVVFEKGLTGNGEEYRLLKFFTVGKEWESVIGEFKKNENISD